MPVATTSAVPRPRRIAQPAYTRFRRSASGVAWGKTAPASFSLGSDSPVSGDSSTRSPALSRRRASAETRCPSRRSRRSPGTSCSTGTSRDASSRRTSAVGSASCRSPASAVCARRSLKISTPRTTRMMAKMVRASVSPPTTAYTTPVASSSRIIGSRSSSTISSTSDSRRSARKRLGPDVARRRSTSAAVSPDGAVSCNAVLTWLAVMLCHMGTPGRRCDTGRCSPTRCSPMAVPPPHALVPRDHSGSASGSGRLARSGSV